MRNRALWAALLVFLASIASAQDNFDPERVRLLIQVIGTNSPAAIEKVVRFPIHRRYPLPPITNEAEFRSQYTELFDDTLVESIRKSDIKTDWQTVGWRGLAFGPGTIWVNSFSDYTIIAINYESSLGTKHWEKLVAQQKADLPAELRTFDSPELEFFSATHHFRVDTIGKVYRLVRFPATTLSTYDLVLHSGVLDFDGNMGDYHIDWKVGSKTYRVSTVSYDGPTRRLLSIYDSRTLEDNPEATSEYDEVEAAKF